jgi:ribonuclease HII
VNERFVFDLDRLQAAGCAHGLVAGADEAGRGCLAGPLVAAAVSWDYGTFADDDFACLDALDDSKKLKREVRETLFGEIVARAQHIVVVSFAPGTIDRRGLHVCNLDGLSRALATLRPVPVLAFVDGFRLDGCEATCEALVGGDGRSAAIAAASIVAKVTRDRLMRDLAGLYALWGFADHVGYATEQHHDAICRHGICELHRRSFNSVAYQQLGLELVTRDEGPVEDPAASD